MLGIGWGEMVLIGALALVIMGPEKFPEFAKVVIRTVRDIRGYMDEVRDEVSKELRPVQNEVRKLSRYDPETYINKLTEEEAKPKTPAVENTGERAYETDWDEEEEQPGADHADSGYYDDQGYYEEPDFGYPEGEADATAAEKTGEAPAGEMAAGQAQEAEPSVTEEPEPPRGGESEATEHPAADEPETPSEQAAGEQEAAPGGDETPNFYDEDQEIEIPERLDG